MAKSKAKTHAAAAGSVQISEQAISREQRERMIAEAAYFHALQRGFSGGSPEDDWLQAEAEINRMIPSARQQKRELAAYKNLRELLEKTLYQVRDTISADTIRHALEQARIQLKNLEEYSADTVDRVAASVEKDMIHAAQRIGTRWEGFSEKTADLFQVWRNHSREFLASATPALSEWLRQATSGVTTGIYRTGDMTAAGTLQCAACGEQVVLTTDAHLPPCAKCRGIEFRRA